MNSLQEKALRITEPVNRPLENLIKGGDGVTEAAEDDDYYYIVTKKCVKPEDDCFWVIDKKTKKAIRAGLYIAWITAIADLKEENAVKMLKEPYLFEQKQWYKGCVKNMAFSFYIIRGINTLYYEKKNH